MNCWNLKLFTSTTCPRCPAAGRTAEELSKSAENLPGGGQFNICRYDVGTPDGMAEAAFYSIMSTPTIVIENCDDSNEPLIYSGEIPAAAEIIATLTS